MLGNVPDPLKTTYFLRQKLENVWATSFAYYKVAMGINGFKTKWQIHS